RYYDSNGRFEKDVLTTLDDKQDGAPLLQPVMRQGRRLAAAEKLATIQARCADQLDALPETLEQIEQSADYPVEISPALQRLTDETNRRLNLV
ncbi:MAG: hypothetical protein JXR29_05530, partial [Methylothermaceae bacterium]|nr:hypothetical protein [Methylothermaceae bacterium]